MCGNNNNNNCVCFISSQTILKVETEKPKIEKIRGIQGFTTIGALMSSQPMIPPGCSEGLDVFSFFL